jgi:hypothetical protein
MIMLTTVNDIEHFLKNNGFDKNDYDFYKKPGIAEIVFVRKRIFVLLKSKKLKKFIDDNKMIGIMINISIRL